MIQKFLIRLMATACLAAMATGFGSCSAPDKEKCNSDYIIKRLVDDVYTSVFQNGGTSREKLTEVATKRLAELLETSQASEGGPDPSFATGKELYAGMTYSFDGGDPFLGSNELLYRMACDGENIVFKFNFIYSIPDRWGNEDEKNAYVFLQMAWQDGDWRLADIIMPNGWNLTGILKHGQWW